LQGHDIQRLLQRDVCQFDGNSPRCEIHVEDHRQARQLAHRIKRRPSHRWSPSCLIAERESGCSFWRPGHQLGIFFPRRHRRGIPGHALLCRDQINRGWTSCAATALDGRSSRPSGIRPAPIPGWTALGAADLVHVPLGASKRALAAFNLYSCYLVGPEALCCSFTGPSRSPSGTLPWRRRYIADFPWHNLSGARHTRPDHSSKTPGFHPRSIFFNQSHQSSIRIKLVQGTTLLLVTSDS